MHYQKENLTTFEKCIFWVHRCKRRKVSPNLDTNKDIKLNVESVDRCSRIKFYHGCSFGLVRVNDVLCILEIEISLLLTKRMMKDALHSASEAARARVQKQHNIAWVQPNLLANHVSNIHFIKFLASKCIVRSSGYIVETKKIYFKIWSCLLMLKRKNIFFKIWSCLEIDGLSWSITERRE